MDFKEKKNKLLKLSIVIILLSVGCVGYYLYSKTYVYTNDAYISGHCSYISPHVAGYVKKIYVDDNEYVKKGQLLLAISPNIFSDKVKQCKASLDVARSRLQEDIKMEKAELAQNKFDLTQYNRYKKLSKLKAESIETFQNYETKLKKSVLNLKARLSQINQDKAQIKKSEAEFSLAKQNLAYTKLYAPFDGWVTKKTVAVGNYVTNGKNLMAIVPKNLYIQANYKETKITHLKVGMPVTITIDSYPGIEFKGHIDSIQSGSGAAFSLLPPENATGNFVKIVQRVPVKIVFDKIPDPSKYKLSIGMSVETKIHLP
ncbi:MAG: HlyD family secretion protein [Victivallales bacterium]|nr:HlyD family secretion protein [Victivallales bacterium]MCF7888622.1 HlyD family secretion protein [Victivallales bacterium]